MLRFSTSAKDDISLDELKVALKTYKTAKQKNEKFVIRLEDENPKIVEVLNLFGIKADEVSYQTHNLKFHQQLATKLLMDKKAFNCFCKDNELQNNYPGTCKNLPDSQVIDNENPFSVRIKKPKNQDKIDDFIILKINKYPTTTFATAIDDMLNNIELIIANEKDKVESGKQAYIRESLGYDKKIDYIFLKSLKNAPSANSLLEQGFLPESIVEYLEKDEDEFDLFALKSLNQKHISNLDSLKLATLVGFKSRDIGELAKYYSKELGTINEIKDKIDKIFSKKDDNLDELKEVVKKAPHFEKFEEFKEHIKQELKNKELSKELATLITGDKSANLSGIYPHIKNYIKEIARWYL